MKRLFFRSMFFLAVLVVLLVLLVPTMAGLGVVFAPKRRPDGLYGNGDSLGPSIIALFGCTWIADRLVGLGFRAAQISGDRWSIFRASRR